MICQQISLTNRIAHLVHQPHQQAEAKTNFRVTTTYEGTVRLWEHPWGDRVGFSSSHLTADNHFPVNPSAITVSPKMSLRLEVKNTPALTIKQSLIRVHTRRDRCYSKPPQDCQQTKCYMPGQILPLKNNCGVFSALERPRLPSECRTASATAVIWHCWICRALGKFLTWNAARYFCPSSRENHH